jgi:hypothetical protein
MTALGIDVDFYTRPISRCLAAAESSRSEVRHRADVGPAQPQRYFHHF